ncbi:GNAT family N-acetyltransferase [Rubricoccus marinus]|uniref:N-acetyltransferase domain-containing protein n=1 Tax=Rubricoccus marinus TaxID=716817 RepID=A0A259TWC4_9BACT|nr:GNAT family N-acetyltransferase [Rubricoccus marinus]OZC02082.1 hypothetical protein BSZ36_03235 [Rubricoccus marinus]
MTVQHDSAHNRFTADTEHGTAELGYRAGGGTIAFVHTRVPEPDRGQDIGSQLVEAGLQHARENDLKVLPECPFVESYMESHPETQDLLARG